MKLAKLIMLLVAFGQGFYVQAQTTNLTQLNYEWYHSNWEKIGDLTVNGSDNDLVPIVNTIGLMWKYRDGAVSSAIAPAISRLFIYHPRITFIWFLKHPDEFKSLVGELPGDLFVGEPDQEGDLLLRKEELLKSLASYSKIEKNLKLKNMADLIYTTITETEIRIID